MNLALTISHGRMAPCFPGVDLHILKPQQAWGAGQTITTNLWSLLAWRYELLRRDVATLLCAGIDQFLWGALHGYGIQVVPNAMGDPKEVLNEWSSGRLRVPLSWPPYPQRGSPWNRWRGRRRFRGGR